MGPGQAGDGTSNNIESSSDSGRNCELRRSASLTRLSHQISGSTHSLRQMLSATTSPRMSVAPGPEPEPDDTGPPSRQAVDEHLLEPEEVAARYGCRLSAQDVLRSGGMDETLARARLERDGRNELSPPKRTHPAIKYLKKLFGLFNAMLLLCGVLSFVIYAVDTSDPSNVPLSLTDAGVDLPRMHPLFHSVCQCRCRVLSGVQDGGDPGGIQGTAG